MRSIRFGVDVGKYLARAFPQEYCSIAERRLENAEFNQICADFEELSALLYDDNTLRSSDFSDEDVVASLDGLRDEIANLLSKLGK